MRAAFVIAVAVLASIPGVAAEGGQQDGQDRPAPPAIRIGRVASAP